MRGVTLFLVGVLVGILAMQTSYLYRKCSGGKSRHFGYSSEHLSFAKTRRERNQSFRNMSKLALVFVFNLDVSGFSF